MFAFSLIFVVVRAGPSSFVTGEDNAPVKIGSSPSHCGSGIIRLCRYSGFVPFQEHQQPSLVSSKTGRGRLFLLKTWRRLGFRLYFKPNIQKLFTTLNGEAGQRRHLCDYMADRNLCLTPKHFHCRKRLVRLPELTLYVAQCVCTCKCQSPTEEPYVCPLGDGEFTTENRSNNLLPLGG